MDRLAEIEREWAYAENGSDKDDVQWLIAEVQRLWSNDEDLLQQLSHAASENTRLKRGDSLELP